MTKIPEIVSPAAEFRRDPTSGQWVIIAPGRAKRPLEYRPVEVREAVCVYCATPKHGDAFSSVREVKNSEIIFQEEIIHSHQHDFWFDRMEPMKIEQVILAWKERFAEAARRFEYVAIYGKRGQRAGSACDHPRSLIEATHRAPRRLACEFAAMAEGDCTFCRLLENAAERMIYENEHFVAFAPYASRFAYETWILPKRHLAGFSATSSGEVTAFADAAHRIFCALERMRPEIAFHYALHSSAPSARDFHWHFEIMPRITNIAGFELGTEILINSVPPEEAAGRLKGELFYIPLRKP